VSSERQEVIIGIVMMKMMAALRDAHDPNRRHDRYVNGGYGGTSLTRVVTV